EEIWQRVAPLAGKQGATIMLQPWPVAAPERIDTQAETDIEWLKLAIVGVRNIRGEMNIGPGKEIPLLLRNGDAADRERVAINEQFLKKLAKLSSVAWLETGAQAPMSATQLAGAVELLVPMADLIDKNAEIARLDKEIDKLAKQIEQLRTKLGNEGFVAKAPADVVAKERERQAGMETALSKLAEQRDQLQKL